MQIALPHPSLWTLDTGLEEVDMGIQLQKDPDLAMLLNFNTIKGADLIDFLDESTYVHTPARTGGAVLTTAQKKFGDASLWVPGSGDYVTVPGHSVFDFGTGDFTIDFFVRFYSLTPTLSPFITSDNYYVDGYNGNFTFRLSATGYPNLGFSFATYDGKGNYEGIGYSFGAGVLVTNQWYHVAAVRSNNVGYIFWDGVKRGEFAFTKALIDAKNEFYIGRWSGYNSYAWFDAFRITLRALWTADFTPPAKESRGYRTDSPTAESPWVSSGKGTLDATTPIFIEENKLAALLGYIGYGTLKYQYALNNGSNNGTWLTLAQLQSALAGQAITVQTNSLRLRVQFNSDGGEAADISGFGSRAEGALVLAEEYHLELPEPLLWTLDTGLEALDFGIRLKRFEDDFADGTRHPVWREYDPGGYYTTSLSPDESGGVLNIDIVASGTTCSGYETVNTVSGDFDVQIDFSNFTTDTAPGGSGYGVKAELSFLIDEDNMFEVHRYQNDSGQTSFVARQTINGVNQQSNFSDYSPASGKLRLVRKGSHIQWYRDCGSGWDLMREIIGFPTGAGRFVIWASTADQATSVSVDFDNFTVNEGQLFSPNALVAESPWISVYKNKLSSTPLGIEENELATLYGYSAGTLKYQYALNNGSYNGTWLILSELNTALDGQAITNKSNSLRLKVQFNSDGAQAVDISGFGSYVEGGAPAVDFILPVEAETEGNEYEATVNLDKYDAEVKTT